MRETFVSDAEFGRLRTLIRRVAGINLSPAKRGLVCGRLSKRMSHHRLESCGEYVNLLVDGHDPEELQAAVDLLTINETYFFREPKHFDFLRNTVFPGRKAGDPFRAWSAACATGEEAYSIAMAAADRFGDGCWEVLASDISLHVLEKARRGQYAMARTENIPQRLLMHHCLKGVGPHDGTLLIDRRLRERVSFLQINLSKTLPAIGEFDVIFLRNVMIYFEPETRREVVARLVPCLKPGGYLLVGHSETLHGATDRLQAVAPSIYRRP